MPHIANLLELLPPAENRIIAFYKLPGIDYTSNIRPMPGLQILRVLFIFTIISFIPI
jgi:hypothetical protein